MMASNVRPSRRLVLFIAIGFGVLAALVGVGLYGLVLAPTPSTPTTATGPSASTASSAQSEASSPIATLPPIPSSSDAETFARTAADALFTWDTASGFGPADYAQVIVDAGDPSGTESAGLASDVRTYLPTTDAWATLRTYATRQWLKIDEAFVPASWSEATDQATPGQLIPGTVAYTITGTRHRAGTVGTQAEETSRPVAFTLFIACAPSFDECRLLRLSEVDNPLR
jgi:hypothetical protein